MDNTINGTSRTTEDGAPFNGLKKPEYLKVTAYILIIVLSLVGNSLVIAVVYKNANQRMRTPSNYFVVSMAVGDELITIINMASQVVVLLYDASFPFGGIVGIICCKIQSFMWMFLVSWSTGSLSAIAVDRFLLVFVPLKRIVTLRTARVVIAAIIIIGAAISSPYLVFAATVVEYRKFRYCSMDMSNFDFYLVYILGLFSLFIFVPFATLLVLYSAIAFKLWLRKSPGNQENRVTMNRRIFPLLITIVVLFILCWMPIAVIHFSCIVGLKFDNDSCRILTNEDSNFTLWFLAYSNSAINPYVYFIFNDSFRHGAKAMWSSICGCRIVLPQRHNRVKDASCPVELQPTGIQ